MKHMTLALLLAPLALQAEIAVQTVAYEDLGNKDRVVTNITGSADADLTPATNYTDSATNELRRTTDEKLAGKLDTEYQGDSSHKGTISFHDGSYPTILFDGFTAEVNTPSATGDNGYGDINVAHGLGINGGTSIYESGIFHHGNNIYFPSPSFISQSGEFVALDFDFEGSIIRFPLRHGLEFGFAWAERLWLLPSYGGTLALLSDIPNDVGNVSTNSAGDLEITGGAYIKGGGGEGIGYGLAVVEPVASPLFIASYTPEHPDLFENYTYLLPEGAFCVSAASWLQDARDTEFNLPIVRYHDAGSYDLAVCDDVFRNADRERVQIGNRLTEASGSGYATAVGTGAKATGSHSAAVGAGGCIASGENSLALGNSVEASGWASTAIGYSTFATGDTSTALGGNSRASGTRALSAGWASAAEGDNSTALGNGARINPGSTGAVAIGSGASVGANATNAVQIGYGQNNDAGTIQYMDKKLAFKDEIVSNGMYVATARINTPSAVGLEHGHCYDIRCTGEMAASLVRFNLPSGQTNIATDGMIRLESRDKDFTLEFASSMPIDYLFTDMTVSRGTSAYFTYTWVGGHWLITRSNVVTTE